MDGLEHRRSNVVFQPIRDLVDTIVNIQRDGTSCYASI